MKPKLAKAYMDTAKIFAELMFTVVAAFNRSLVQIPLVTFNN